MDIKLPIKPNLDGKVVVITGAGGVICAHLAKAIAKCNAKVCLLDINYESVKIVEEEIVSYGYVAKAYKANCLDKDDLEKVKDEIVSDFSTVDILINGAGGNNPKATTSIEYHDELVDASAISFFDLDPKGIDFVFALNFQGTLLPTQVFAKLMVGKNASILNISSMNAFRPLTKIPAYSAAKAAVTNFTQWLAVHFSKANIRVNAIAPGFLVTNQNYNLLFDENNNPTARTKKILNATPMGRFGEVDDLVGATLFLIDEASSKFITGITLPIDGGFSSYSGV